MNKVIILLILLLPFMPYIKTLIIKFFDSIRIWTEKAYYKQFGEISPGIRKIFDLAGAYPVLIASLVDNVIKILITFYFLNLVWYNSTFETAIILGMAIMIKIMASKNGKL